MKKFLIDLLLLAILLLIAYIFSFATTGLVASGGEVSVGVKGVFRGNLTAFTYYPTLTIGDNQTVFVEFENGGSTTYNISIREKIYFYENGILNPWAEYYDATVPLYAYRTRSFTTHFIPNSTGIYYIQLKIRYSTRMLETWGLFTVAGITVYLPSTQEFLPGAPGPAPPQDRVPELTVQYPGVVNISQNQSTIIDILVSNTGNTYLHDIRMYLSTTNLIDIEISPKEIIRLKYNESESFLILVNVPETTPLGEYSLDFEITSKEDREEGRITLNVSALDIIRAEDVYQRILNYEFLIAELESDILSAYLDGVDITFANQSMNNAKEHLEKARDHYNLGNYQDALERLNKAERDLMDAVFHLSNARIILYAMPAIPLFIFIVIFTILAIIAFLAYMYYEKKKKRRPRLLPASGI